MPPRRCSFISLSLFHVQVELNKHNVDDSDVFILDAGLQVYQYNGSTCNKDEKMKVGMNVMNVQIIPNNAGALLFILFTCD